MNSNGDQTMARRVIKVRETPITPELEHSTSEIKYVGPIGAGIPRWPVGDPDLEPKDPRIAETQVVEAQPGVYNEEYDCAEDDMDHYVYDPALDPDVAETVVHEAQPGVEIRSHLKDADVGTKRETVPPPRGPGVPSGGRRLRRHLKD